MIMTSARQISVLESLLFISGEPLSFGRLAKILKINNDEIEVCIQALAEKYGRDAERGLMLIVKDQKVTLATKSENADFVEALTKSVLKEDLSKAALEVLSIIAYLSPIPRVEIEAIRGVNCSFTLRNLLLRDLIERQGNPQDARGYVYFPTFKFLQFLGLKNVADLPDYATFSQDQRLKTLLTEDVEKQDD